MTTIRFYRAPDGLCGFTSQGHSGYAEAGDDIVCAAVSAAIGVAECTISDIYAAGADVSSDERIPRISLRLRDDCPNRTGCQATLEGLLLYLKQMQLVYPEHLSVLEV